MISVIYVFLILIVIALFIAYATTKIEGFDAVGLYNNVPPNWFIKNEYNPQDWVVNTYFNAIQPSCLPYDKASKYGSLENINYLAGASRFWRF